MHGEYLVGKGLKLPALASFSLNTSVWWWGRKNYRVCCVYLNSYRRALFRFSLGDKCWNHTECCAGESVNCGCGVIEIFQSRSVAAVLCSAEWLRCEWLVSDSIYRTMCKWVHIRGGSWIFAYCDHWMSAVWESARQLVGLCECSSSPPSQIILLKIAF